MLNSDDSKKFSGKTSDSLILRYEIAKYSYLHEGMSCEISAFSDGFSGKY